MQIILNKSDSSENSINSFTYYLNDILINEIREKRNSGKLRFIKLDKANQNTVYDVYLDGVHELRQWIGSIKSDISKGVVSQYIDNTFNISKIKNPVKLIFTHDGSNTVDQNIIQAQSESGSGSSESSLYYYDYRDSIAAMRFPFVNNTNDVNNFGFTMSQNGNISFGIVDNRQSVVFDGNSYIQLNNSDSDFFFQGPNISAWTLSFWIRTSEDGGTVLVLKGSDVSSGFSLSVNTVVDDNNWHYVILDSSGNLYIDNVLQTNNLGNIFNVPGDYTVFGADFVENTVVSDFHTILNNEPFILYSTADGVSKPNGLFNAVVTGNIINSVLDGRECMIFPNDTSIRHFNLSSYNSGPHIQDSVSFSFWVNVSNGPVNTNQCVFCIKNSGVSENEERFIIRVNRINTDLRITCVFRDINGSLVCSMQDLQPASQTSWDHFVVLIAAGDYRMFRNGVECVYNVTNFRLTGVDKPTLYGTFKNIEQDDEVYLGTNRLITETTEGGASTNYTALLAGGNVTGQYVTGSGSDVSDNSRDATLVPTGALTNVTINDGTRTREGFISNGTSIIDLLAHASNLWPNFENTLSFWYHRNTADPTPTQKTIFYLKSTGGPVVLVRDMLSSSSTPEINIRFGQHGSGYSKSQATHAFNANEWVHIVVMSMSSPPYVRAYINGTDAVQQATNVGMSVGTQVFDYCAFFDDGNNRNLPAGGVISNVLFFDRELTATEVGYLYMGDNKGTDVLVPSFSDPFRSALSEFRIFPKILSETHISDLYGEQPNTTTVDPTNHFSGSMSELLVFDKLLDADARNAIYNETVKPPENNNNGDEIILQSNQE